MFGLTSKRNSNSLAQRVRLHLPAADEATVAIVASMASLLAAVAYADRDWSPAEARYLREQLARVQGLSARDAEAIVAILADTKLELATTQVAQSARVLRQEADRDLRLEVLRLLVGTAAADGVIELTEVTMLRTITTALGLSQDDYNDVQEGFREKLSFFKGRRE